MGPLPSRSSEGPSHAGPRPQTPRLSASEMKCLLLSRTSWAALLWLPQEAEMHHALSRCREQSASSARASFCPREEWVLLKALSLLPRGCPLAHQPGPICPLGFLSLSLHSDVQAGPETFLASKGQELLCPYPLVPLSWSRVTRTLLTVSQVTSGKSSCCGVFSPPPQTSVKGL